MWKVGNDFEPLKEQQNRVFAIGWYSSPPGGNSEGIRSCPGRLSMNEYKAAWYSQSMQLRESGHTADELRVRLVHAKNVMFKKRSNRSKWERIGRPMLEHVIDIGIILWPTTPPKLRQKAMQDTIERFMKVK